MLPTRRPMELLAVMATGGRRRRDRSHALAEELPSGTAIRAHGTFHTADGVLIASLAQEARLREPR